MSRSGRSVGLIGAAIVAVVVSGVVALGQTNKDQSPSRGVHIIEAPTPSPPATASPGVLSPAPESSAPALLTPSPSIAPPASGLGQPKPAPAATFPPILSPAPEPRPNDASPPATQGGEYLVPPPSGGVANLPNSTATGSQPSLQEIEALSNGPKLPNAAGLSMQILPGPEITVGSQVSIHVTSEKPGYLILLDVSANGRLAQIYPNPMSLMVPGGVRENLNLLKPGKPMRIPDSQNPYAGFELIASPPSGTAMLLALLSERPVQLVDLPDVPPPMLGSASAVDYLAKIANELRIPSGGDRLDEAHWSFDVKFYAIR